MMAYKKDLWIRTTSDKFGPVDFEIVGNIASKIDMKGDLFSPTRSFDESVKWVLDEINAMRQESPDLYFVR